MQPEFLHLVLASDIGDDKPSIQDVIILQKQFIETFKKGRNVHKDES